MHATLLQIQFALFYREIIERPDTLFKKFIEENEEIYDAIPISQNIPIGLPVDIPIKVLKSENNKYNCNISRERVDFICQRVDDEESNEDLFSRFNLNLERNIKLILSKTKIKRFGLIATYFIECQNPVETIQTKYTPNLKDKLSELSLNYNKKHNYKNFEINDIINISLGNTVKNGNSNAGIIIQRDINNQPYINKDDIEIQTLRDISKKYSDYISENSILELIN